MRGSGKGAEGWFALSDASVYFDHPVHANDEHTLNIDLVNPARGPGYRVAIELDAASVGLRADRGQHDQRASSAPPTSASVSNARSSAPYLRIIAPAACPPWCAQATVPKRYRLSMKSPTPTPCGEARPRPS